MHRRIQGECRPFAQAAAKSECGKLAKPDRMGRFKMTQSAELYACFYAREFPAQALLRLRPELREQPCVVMEGDPPVEQVCSFNAKARLLGMRRGMTRVEVDTFPTSVVLTRSLKTEAETREIGRAHV